MTEQSIPIRKRSKRMAIVIAVIIIVAIIASLLIYNAVRDGSGGQDGVAPTTTVEGDSEPDSVTTTTTTVPASEREQGLLESDEEGEVITGDEISDVRYLATNICPDLETRHWHSTISDGRDVDPTRTLYPPNGLYEGRTPRAVRPEGGNPTLIPFNSNWIEADGHTVILSPTISNRGTGRCSYKGTDDYSAQISDVSHLVTYISAPIGRYGGLRPLVFTELSPLRYSDCLRSGLSPVSERELTTCELHFASSADTHSERTETAIVGAARRASWQLLSYCALAGGFIPFVPISHISNDTYEKTNFNRCVVRPEQTNRTCTFVGLGLYDPDRQRAFSGISVIGTEKWCEITETSKEVGKLTVDSTATRVSYVPLPAPARGACLTWRTTGRATTLSPEPRGTSGGLPECVYMTSSASASYCASLGLKLKRESSSCAYQVATPNPECPERFLISRETGEAKCVEPLGTVSSRWERVCLGWDNTNSTRYESNGSTTLDDGSNVYAYYSSSTDTYRCSFKNRYANSIRECLSFGYLPSDNVGECEVVGRRTYNPRPYPPTCAVTRATPYHTSQEQLWSISRLDLAFRARSAYRNSTTLTDRPSSPTVTNWVPDPFVLPPIAINPNPDNNGFIYDYNFNVAPNINKQLPYYYSRIIKPAVESYLTTGARYNELWLPSQFPTGNVSWSRTFGQNGYPTKFSKEDPMEASTIDFLYNRRSPNPINNCDDYKQFYRPIHIEKSSASRQEYTVGYNDQDRSVVCDSASAQNFWEPRYYLDALSSDSTYPSGSYCGSGTTTCAGRKVGTNLYRECGLSGTDTPFIRPSESSDSSFNFQNQDINHSINTYVKECEDIGYTGGDTELFDYQTLERLATGRISVDLSRVRYSSSLPGLVAPVNTEFFNYHPHINDVSFNINPRNHVDLSNPFIWYHDMWVRSDTRMNKIDATSPQFYLLNSFGGVPSEPDEEGGLTWTRYGISEMLNYIQNQNLASVGGVSSRSAVLRFPDTRNFNQRTQRILQDFRALNNPADPSSWRVGYFSGGGFSASRGGTSSNLTHYAPYAEQQCAFRVPDGASEEVQAFFRACQSLSTYFPTRFSYHKPIEVKDFNVADVAYSTNSVPADDNYGHWRAGLLTERGGSKHPSLIKYGDARYKPPTYFHLKTDRTNGFYYCEANPYRGQEAGVIPVAATRTSAQTYMVDNTACDLLNQAIGTSSAGSSTTFETISKMSNNEAEIKASSALGFVGHKEGPYDYYHCKWRAPFKGNPLAR